MDVKRIEAPKLEIDARIEQSYGRKLSSRDVLERRIVANLIAYLEEKGFKVDSVYDGEEYEDLDPAKPESLMQQAMELIFNLDEAIVYFKKENFKEHSVNLILGEGEDIICDYTYSEPDADGFKAAMEAFDVSNYF